MIIARISNGLGNQLFQYSLGRHLAIKNNADLKLDISAFQYDFREYMLNFFNIAGETSTQKDYHAIGLPDMEKQSYFSRLRRKIFRNQEKNSPIYRRSIILEPQFQFCEDILKAKNNCYLSGNWQSEKYFLDIADTIKKDLTLKNEPSQLFKQWTKKIDNCQSVSLHIRRGDYISSQKVNQFHGTCNLEYYQKAIDLIAEIIKNPKFFISSDDIAWARNNLKINYPVYFISDKNIPDYEELIIMSNCRHNIIANSSFSWWGAWLNGSPNKIVIAPQKWFNAPTDTTDLLPDSWIKI